MSNDQDPKRTFDKKDDAESLLTDDENHVSLDDFLSEEEEVLDEGYDEDSEEIEDDPWEKQVRMGQKQSSQKYGVWD